MPDRVRDLRVKDLLPARDRMPIYVF
jgi:hypothetical protein